MKTKTDVILENGGLLTDGVEVDPVSGNEVPPGSNAEDVRDDIPSMLSSNEYVVPADVLRYYGVKFFEGLREKAKNKLGEMDAEGRIGGDPVEPEGTYEEDDMPFSLEELSVVDDDEPEMAKGGYVKGYADGGTVVDPTKMVTPDFLANPAAPTQAGTDEYRTFTNEAGMTMSVRFVDGKPLSYIPPGYTEGAAEVEETIAEEVRREEDGARGDSRSAAATRTEPTASTTSNGSSFSGLGLGDSVSDAIAGFGVNALASAINPGLAVAGKVTGTTGAISDKVSNFMQGKGFVSTDDIDTSSTEAPASGGMFSDRNDINNDGKRNFGDTFVGDLLGFDGKAGIQEGPGLAASLGGARRSGGNEGGNNGGGTSGGGTTSSSTPTASTPSTSARDRAQAAADREGQSLATGGRATGGLVSKRKHKK